MQAALGDLLASAMLEADLAARVAVLSQVEAQHAAPSSAELKDGQPPSPEELERRAAVKAEAERQEAERRARIKADASAKTKKFADWQTSHDAEGVDFRGHPDDLWTRRAALKAREALEKAGWTVHEVAQAKTTESTYVYATKGGRVVEVRSSSHSPGGIEKSEERAGSRGKLIEKTASGEIKRVEYGSAKRPGVIYIADEADVVKMVSGEIPAVRVSQFGGPLPESIRPPRVEYAKIEVPLIENTPGIPNVVGSFHDPEFARASYEFLSAKKAMLPDDYMSLAQDQRARAFTMSGVENTELLTSVKDSLAEVVKRGGTEADFRKAVELTFEDFGVTGPEPWRTKLVFDTNVAQAQSDGEWEQVHEEGVIESFPFFRYRTRGDERVRPNHAWMNMRVYASDDPVWDEWWPPAGFNCRCWIDYISRYEAEQQGIVADVERPFMPPDEGFGLGEKQA